MDKRSVPMLVSSRVHCVCLCAWANMVHQSTWPGLDWTPPVSAAAAGTFVVQPTHPQASAHCQPQQCDNNNNNISFAHCLYESSCLCYMVCHIKFWWLLPSAKEDRQSSTYPSSTRSPPHTHFSKPLRCLPRSRRPGKRGMRNPKVVKATMRPHARYTSIPRASHDT